MTSRVWAVSAAVGLLLASVPGLARADAAETGAQLQEKVITVLQQDSPSTSPAPHGEGPALSGTGQDPALARSLATERQRMQTRLASPTALPPGRAAPRLGPVPSLSPPFSALDCQNEPFAETSGGFVIDHYRYCEVTRWTARTIVCSFRLPLLGCVRKEEIGHAEFRLSTAGYGWDATMIKPGDWVDPTLNQISWVTFLDDWHNVWGVAPETPLSISQVCAAQNPVAPCREDVLGKGFTQTIAQWMADGGWYHRWLENPIDGLGADNLAYFDFHTHLAYGTLPTGSVGDTLGDRYRCDFALYLKGDRGCMFDRLVSVFGELTLSGTAPYRKEALHIYDAMFRPEVTQPQVPGKQVPGNPFASSPRPLTRAYEGYESALVRANHAEAVRTCTAWWGPDYSQGGQFDCDEYPFKSTFQGASVANGNYSARVIDASDNRSGGGILGNWYTNQRILHEDPYWVMLVQGTGGGGGGGGMPDRPPSVSAGPDASGNEGSGIVLHGSAYDVESTPSVRWSYSAGPDVDSGATCTFGNATAAATTIECTDDGTFTVMLSASDGVNAPVSASAVVHIHNVAPLLALGTPPTATAAQPTASGPSPQVTAQAPGPAPWSVYRAGSTVTLTAPFDDPGSNDTQTCVVDWDDGGRADSYAATAHSCDRTHTYLHAGMYTITLTVTDDDTGADDSLTMVVIYDPDGGFATGGGFINSPAGAVTSDPTATGKLHFQFNPKYQKRDEGPAPGAGRVSVKLDGGTLDLRSTDLEWLVVTPDGKVAVKGTGAVGGQQGYGFVLYGYAQPDQFRLVVWPLSAGDIPGDATFYDNRPAAGYDVDRADPQDLAGGSVNVHR
jgi:PKD repeat protein